MKAIRFTLLIGILGLGLLGCEQFNEFQQDERNRAARPYQELELFPQDLTVLADLPAPKLPASFANRVSWTNLFNGKDLTDWAETDYAGRGNVVVKNGELHIENGLVITGVHYTNKTVLPKTNYEITYQAKKINGSDFFALLTFPVDVCFWGSFYGASSTFALHSMAPLQLRQCGEKIRQCGEKIRHCGEKDTAVW